MDTSTTMPTEYSRQSPYSDPGQHAGLLAAVAPDRASVSAAARAAIVHYRSGLEPSDDQRGDPDRRWLTSILDAAVARQPGPIDAPRAAARQVTGCCRDHTLLALGVLREHGVPARSRVGFAGYFTPSFHHDHVVVEEWDGQRWVRWDPELEPGSEWDFDPRDMPTGPAAPFQTAAEAWRAIRAGEADPTRYGVDPSLPHLGGKDFVRDYVLLEVAHRQCDELLLWDLWGPMLQTGLPGVPELAARAGLQV
ncbi:MAG: transglutaminase-like domain-containing protein, partial [Actinomycetota bacterium]|nr:transglutaminase-like domain-containing protein [Actinomycetota bacterium]